MNVRSWIALVAIVAAATPARADAIAEIFQRVADSVVVIRATDRDASDRPGMVGAEETELGSGVLIENTRVLTAAHVVQVADSIVVQVGGRSRRPSSPRSLPPTSR
jgi:S1-C subfamily serine protease